MHCLVIILGPIWLAQTVLAVTCLKKYPRSRIAAFVLMTVSPLPVVTALFGESILRAIHVPSSFDPVGDGFDILSKCVAVVVSTVFLSVAASVWLSFGIGGPSDRSS